MVDTEPDFLSSIPDVCTYIQEEVSKLRPRKIQIQQQVELAVRTSSSSLLGACSVQLVGSVSWGGEVPQSDLDMMLCSTDTNYDRNTAIFLLQELCRSLQEQSKKGSFDWTRVELMDSARIPILFVEDSEGCRCDIGVDQLQALYHRDFLLETLEAQDEGHQHIGDLVRLVKFWVRQRGLPLASEGGLPSLAWVFAALCLADGQPVGTSLEVLLMHFFSEMCQLLSHRLQVLPCSAHGWRTFWLDYDKPNPWHKEWIHSFQVMDPSDSHGQSVPEITSHRMPTALVSLYVAELRMAWSAIREGQWRKVWQPVTHEAAASLLTALTHPSQGSPIHVVLKDGTVVAGTVEEQGCQGDLSAKDLQRRDQTLQLHLQPCKIDPKGTSFLLEHKMVFHPSQWICALPTSEIQMTKGVALSRVAEIAEMLGVAQTSHGLHGIVAMLKYRPMQMPMAMPGCYYGMVWGCPMVTGQGQIEQANESSFTHQHKQVQRTLRRVFDKFGDLESEESTRASDNDSHSSTRSLQISQGRAKHGYNRNATNTSTNSMERGQDTVSRSTKSNKKSQKLASTRQEAETRGDTKK